MGQYPSASSLQENITALKPTTWETIHEVVTRYAASEKFEKGRKVRLDSTTVESNIHYPTDSSLLWDVYRTLARLIRQRQRRCDIRRHQPPMRQPAMRPCRG